MAQSQAAASLCASGRVNTGSRASTSRGNPATATPKADVERLLG